MENSTLITPEQTITIPKDRIPLPLLSSANSAPAVIIPPIDPLQKLRRINKIEINDFVKRDGVTYYILEVYLHPSNNSALNSQNPSPDYTVERRFAEFAYIAKEVEAWRCYSYRTCDYCGGGFSLAQSRNWTQPRLLVKMFTLPSQRKSILQNFVNEFIKLSLEEQPDERINSAGQPTSGECLGHRKIPGVVYRLIRPGSCNEENEIIPESPTVS